MSLALHIARRYLFSKKRVGAINLISAITAAGVMVGTAALICILSVYNGFGDVVESMYSKFDPQIKITATRGKTISLTDPAVEKARENESVAFWCPVVEEQVLFRFGERQTTGYIKGVSEDFNRMAHLERILLYNDKFLLSDGVFNYGIAGVGLAAELGFVAHLTQSLKIYAPRRIGNINIANPANSFNEKYVFISALFSVQQAEYDNSLLLVPLALARELYEYDDDVATAIEVGLKSQSNISKTKQQLQETLGDDFVVQDRWQQQADYFRIMQVEKWITFLILTFILLIAVANVIGCLSMLIIDKSDDIKTLHNLGASEQLTRRIFLFEGWLISLTGALAGVFLGSTLCLLQQAFGFITIPSADLTVMEAYPVSLQFTDVVLSLLTVCLMGFVAAYIPARKISLRSLEQAQQS
ncbi:MAG: ABC transporter permease [Paludibacteraceae bacterium]|nr:ABC transporter permease [Paludibacteraceae bacterium]